jgi:transcription initiation factor TFIID TATA-box-binding protein
MTNITIENIIANAKVADELDIHRIAEKVPGFMYDPTEFLGLTLKLDKPNVAILLLPNGKVICTGAKKIEDIEYSLKEVVNKIKSIGVKTKTKTDIEIQNIVASFELEKELNLSIISKGLMLENTSYEPDQFPGLVYNIEELGAILLVFSTGKIVCTGVKNFEDASKAIEIMKDKILSIGAL